MDALNHADQMRLANLINDNSDDADIQKKLDQVVELTSSTRDQAAVALHDCHYDVEKAVDMILEGDHANVESQWKSAGKKKNKNLSSQAAKGGHSVNAGKNSGSSNKNHTATSVSSNTGPTTVTQHSSGHAGNSSGKDSHHHHHQTNRGNNQSGASSQPVSNSQFNSSSTSSINANNNNNNNNSNKQDASDSLKNIVGASSSTLITSSDPTTTATTTTTALTKTSSPQQPQQTRPRGAAQVGGRQYQRSTRIPDSAVEMPNNELQTSSLNVQFGELNLGDNADTKGTFQDVLESNRLGRQSGLQNSHTTIPSQDSKSNRHTSQPHAGRGGPRRPYNNNNEDRRYYNSNSNRGGRQISGNQRPYNQRPGQINSNNNSNNSNPRGVRTIMNRGLQANSTMPSSGLNQPSGGFPNSIDTWTNSTAEVAPKAQTTDPATSVAGAMRVGQWSDVAGNEDWSEEEHWDAKVMETKVFTPSSKAADVPGQKPLLNDASVPSHLASKLSETVRDDVSSQPNTLNTVNQSVQTQQSSQKPLSHMNDIFDPSLAKAVLEQQNLAALKPKAAMGIGQYNKDTSEAKAVLDPQNLGSMKSKNPITMNQYNKEASESLKSLVGISSSGAKGGVPSVPPGALPLMSQPQYMMGTAYQPAIFPYAYQTQDVHYPVAPAAGRDQNFPSIYSTSDGSKFNRGTDGDAPSITTTQTAPVASQTHNQAFVTNALHAGYQMAYAMPGAFNMMPQNLYGAAPIFPHIPQPTNTGSASNVYQKNTQASYQHHTGYSGYDQLNPLIQDYVKQQQNYSGSNMQHQQPTSKSSGVSSELDVAAAAAAAASAGGNSYNMYSGSVDKGQAQQRKQTNYNDAKGYQHQMSSNGPQPQFGFSHNAQQQQQQQATMASYQMLQQHNLDGSNMNPQGGAQSQLQHSSQRSAGSQVNQNKYYQSWN